jgi:hypothetical protein
MAGPVISTLRSIGSDGMIQMSMMACRFGRPFFAWSRTTAVADRPSLLWTRGASAILLIYCFCSGICGLSVLSIQLGILTIGAVEVGTRKKAPAGIRTMTEPAIGLVAQGLDDSGSAWRAQQPREGFD